VNHCQVEVVLHLVKLVAEGDAVPVGIRIEQDDRTAIAARLHGVQIGFDRRDPDAAGDHNEPLGILVAVDGEGAVGAVDIGARADRRLDQFRGVVAQGLDREGQVGPVFRRGRDGEGMLLQRDGRAPNAEPGELAGLPEAQRLALGLQFQRVDAAAMRGVAHDAPRIAQLVQGHAQPRPDEESDPAHRHADPERALVPGRSVAADAQNMRDRRGEADDGKHQVQIAPPLVLQPKELAEFRRDDQRDEAEERDPARGQLPPCLERVELAQGGLVPDVEDGEMREHQRHRAPAQVAVEIVDDVGPERVREPAHPPGERELHRRQRQGAEAQPHREIP
jgi:hypothetical protein